jgi:hypothetical protein
MALTTNLRLQTIEGSDYFCPDKISDNFSSLDKLGVDYIVSQGSDDTWHWRKWKSGIAECWGTKYFEETATLGMIQCGITYPFTFAKEPTPVVNVAVDGRTDAYPSYVGTSGSTTDLDCYVYKGTTDSLGFHAMYSVKGRWK